MAYIGSSPTKVVSRQSANIFTYTATANQTAFTGTDANGNTLACTPSDIMVHMNGLRLEESDFTASTTTVTLGSGAAAGDEVTITAFVTFETADAYTKSAADARYVNVTGGNITGDLTVDTDTLKVDSSNDRVLINTTTEGRHSEGADILTIAAPDDGHSGITVRSGTSSYGSLYFSDATSGAGEYAGSMQFNHSNNQLALGVAGSDYLKIDSSGHVTIPSQPAIQAGSSVVQNFANSSTNYQMAFGVTQFSRGGLTRNGNVFTVPVGGYYVVNYAISADIQNNIRAFGVRLQKNGSGSGAHDYHGAYRHSTGSLYTHHMFSGTFLADCATNDTLSINGIVYDTVVSMNFGIQAYIYLLG